ncbi:MAG TPA: BlaI/MecI/CopY family transcriptional regulator [Polyangiaceae bacterium]|jgi:predicted transcriptional regulator|nr:BlaI/MecI/CopY family transcriptional regulator [Polyangiaceae bacterium]
MVKSELTRREREIMDVIYRLGKASAQEVLDGLASPPSYSAVRALLRLLEERGHVKHVQEGQRYVYSAVISPHKASRNALGHVVQTFFAGSVADAMLALVDGSRERLTRDELEKLAAVVERARKAGK